MLSPIEQHYNKHKEELRLQRRHGQVEFSVTMHYLQRYLTPGCRILDIGAGTGHYTLALRKMGYEVDAIELVKRNIDVMLRQDPTVHVRQADARDLSFIADEQFDVALLFGPMYHLMNEQEQLKALSEARRVLKTGGVLFVAYLQNEYSIIQYCFDQNRMADLVRSGHVDEEFHIRPDKDELYNYIRLSDATRMNEALGLHRIAVFSPDGPTDYVRLKINYMTDENFALYIKYVTQIAERPDLIGAASHLVDVLRKD